jgi:hypothetical protein
MRTLLMLLDLLSGFSSAPRLTLAMVAILFAIFACSVLNNYAQHARATEVARTSTAAAIKNLRRVLDPHLSEWQISSNQAVKRLDAKQAGLDNGGRIDEIIYGQCADEKFYLYAVKFPYDRRVFAQGFSYVPGGEPTSCHPQGWQVNKVAPLGDGWSSILLWTRVGTATPSPQ